MNIAIIGTGNMGSTEAGHQVWLGSREARKRGTRFQGDPCRWAEKRPVH